MPGPALREAWCVHHRQKPANRSVTQPVSQGRRAQKSRHQTYTRRKKSHVAVPVNAASGVKIVARRHDDAHRHPMTKDHSGHAGCSSARSCFADMAKARAIPSSLQPASIIRVCPSGHPRWASCRQSAEVIDMLAAERCPARFAPRVREGRPPAGRISAKALCAQLCDIAAHVFRL